MVNKQHLGLCLLKPKSVVSSAHGSNVSFQEMQASLLFDSDIKYRIHQYVSSSKSGMVLIEA